MGKSFREWLLGCTNLKVWQNLTFQIRVIFAFLKRFKLLNHFRYCMHFIKTRKSLSEFCSYFQKIKAIFFLHVFSTFGHVWNFGFEYFFFFYECWTLILSPIAGNLLLIENRIMKVDQTLRKYVLLSNNSSSTTLERILNSIFNINILKINFSHNLFFSTSYYLSFFVTRYPSYEVK